jgi:hypothetical protein
VGKWFLTLKELGFWHFVKNFTTYLKLLQYLPCASLSLAEFSSLELSFVSSPLSSRSSYDFFGRKNIILAQFFSAGNKIKTQ